MACLLTTSLIISGCSKDVQCDVNSKHLHLYYDAKMELTKYIAGEKEHVGSFKWTSEYVPQNDLNNYLCEHSLSCVKDNYDYLLALMHDKQSHLQEYTKDYIYGSYVGLCYNYDPNTDKGSYGYGVTYGFHYAYNWQDIPDDYQTTNKVRQVNYGYKLYKIIDNKQISKIFPNLDNIGEYQYFNPNTVLAETYSQEYYLGKSKTLKK